MTCSQDQTRTQCRDALDPNGVDVGFSDPFPPSGEEDGTCVTYYPGYIDPGPEAARLNPFEGGAFANDLMRIYNKYLSFFDCLVK